MGKIVIQGSVTQKGPGSSGYEGLSPETSGLLATGCAKFLSKLGSLAQWLEVIRVEPWTGYHGRDVVFDVFLVFGYPNQDKLESRFHIDPSRLAAEQRGRALDEVINAMALECLKSGIQTRISLMQSHATKWSGLQAQLQG